jgi:hypothetical protein
VTCRNCEKQGHFSRDCPEPKDWSKVQCQNCQEFGHTIKVSRFHAHASVNANVYSAARPLPLKEMPWVEVDLSRPPVAGALGVMTPRLLEEARLLGAVVVAGRVLILSRAGETRSEHNDIYVNDNVMATARPRTVTQCTQDCSWGHTR